MRKHTYKLTFQSSLQFIFFYKLFTRLFSKMEGDAKKEKFSKQNPILIEKGILGTLVLNYFFIFGAQVSVLGTSSPFFD